MNHPKAVVILPAMATTAAISSHVCGGRARFQTRMAPVAGSDTNTAGSQLWRAERRRGRFIFRLKWIGSTATETIVIGMQQDHATPMMPA